MSDECDANAHTRFKCMDVQGTRASGRFKNALKSNQQREMCLRGWMSGWMNV